MYPPRVEYHHLRPSGVRSAAPSPRTLDMAYSHYAPGLGSNFDGGFPRFPLSSHLPQGQGCLQPTQPPMMVHQPSMQSSQFQVQPPQPSQTAYLEPSSQFQMQSIQSLIHLPERTHFMPPLPLRLPAEMPPPPPAGPPPSPPPPPPLPEEKMLFESWLPSQPKVPGDHEMVTNIEVLAAFVVKNGIQFERMARAKRAGDPKFAFLFASDPGTEAGIGREYYEWRKRSLELEITKKADNMPNRGSDYRETLEWKQGANNIPGPTAGTAVPSGSPSLSDVEMEDVSAPALEKDKCDEHPIREAFFVASPAAVKCTTKQMVVAQDRDNKIKEGLVMEDLSPACSPRVNVNMNEFQVPKDGFASKLKSGLPCSTFEQHKEQSKRPSNDECLKIDDAAESSDGEQGVLDARRFGDDGLSRISDAYRDGDYSSFTKPFANSDDERELENNSLKDDYQDRKVVTLQESKEREEEQLQQIDPDEQLKKNSSQSSQKHKSRRQNLDSSPAHSRSRSESPKWGSCSKPPRDWVERDLMDRGWTAERSGEDLLVSEHAKEKGFRGMPSDLLQGEGTGVANLRKPQNLVGGWTGSDSVVEMSSASLVTEEDQFKELEMALNRRGMIASQEVKSSKMEKAGPTAHQESSIQKYPTVGHPSFPSSTKTYVPSVTDSQHSFFASQPVPSGTHQSSANGQLVVQRDPTLIVQEASPTVQHAFSGNLSVQQISVYPPPPQDSSHQFQQHSEPFSIPPASSKQAFTMETTSNQQPYSSLGPLRQTPPFMPNVQPGVSPVYHSPLPSESGFPQTFAGPLQPVFTTKNTVSPFSENPAVSQQASVSTSMPVQHGFNAMTVLAFKPSLPRPFIGETSKHFTFPTLAKNDAQGGMSGGAVTSISTSMLHSSNMGMSSTTCDAAMQISGSSQPSILRYSSSSMVSGFPPYQSKSDTSPGKPYDPLADSIEPEALFRWERAPLMANHEIQTEILKATQPGDVGPTLGNTSISATEKIGTMSLKVPETVLENQRSLTAADEDMVRGVENLSSPEGKGGIEQAQVKVKKSEDRGIKLLRAAIAEYAKEVLKPAWREGHMTKDEFKTIVKKAVDKVIGTLQSHQIPKSQEKVDLYMASSRAKISKLVQSYVDKHAKT